MTRRPVATVAMVERPFSPSSPRRCCGCGRQALGVVWALVVCATCGERINRAAPTDVTRGLGFVLAVCAFVQGLRERPSEVAS